MLDFLFGERVVHVKEKTYTKEEVVYILNTLVEHPNKPGYKRKDVMELIKKIKNT